jgi:hypothetical protein
MQELKDRDFKKIIAYGIACQGKQTFVASQVFHF